MAAKICSVNLLTAALLSPTFMVPLTSVLFICSMDQIASLLAPLASLRVIPASSSSSKTAPAPLSLTRMALFGAAFSALAAISAKISLPISVRSVSWKLVYS